MSVKRTELKPRPPFLLYNPNQYGVGGVDAEDGVTRVGCQKDMRRNSGVVP